MSNGSKIVPLYAQNSDAFKKPDQFSDISDVLRILHLNTELVQYLDLYCTCYLKLDTIKRMHTILMGCKEKEMGKGN